jgi:hypothetical protein
MQSVCIARLMGQHFAADPLDFGELALVELPDRMP